MKDDVSITNRAPQILNGGSNLAEVRVRIKGTDGEITIPCSDWSARFADKETGNYILSGFRDQGWLDVDNWNKLRSAVNRSSLPQTGSGEIKILEGGELVGYRTVDK